MDWEAFSVKDWWGGSPLEEYAARAEQATDEYARAVDLLSFSEADYLRAYHRSFACTDPSWSNVKRDSAAEADALEERIAFKSAEHNVERWKAILRTRLQVLSSAQTHARMVERQT